MTRDQATSTALGLWHIARMIFWGAIEVGADYVGERAAAIEGHAHGRLVDADDAVGRVTGMAG